MTSKRKAVDEILGHVRKSPAHLMPTKDPQSIWMERIESDPYLNDQYHEGTPQKSKAVGETMPEIFSTARQDLTYSDYTVGWICALPETELVAACEMLDEEHPMLPAADGDTNVYFLGRIGSHNVVIACLPDGSIGKSSAATVAKDMLRSFKKVRFGVLVGVGGGAPYLRNSDNSKATAEGSDEEDEEDEEFGDIRDIRLGDVVISLHSKSSEAVVQYDFGKSVQGGVFFRTGTLNKPPHILCAAVGKLKARHIAHGHKLSDHLSKISANLRLASKFQYQGASKDQLFKANVVHSEGRKICKDCCGALNVNLVKRKERHDTSPALHYGTIGSADQVIKDSTLRNKWAKKENIICFEMEAAGLMDSFPCLVIRGICDYADSHKNKIWQPYAAATAAAYAKELLNVISGAEVTKMRTVNEAMEKLSADIAVNTAVSQRVEKHVLTADELSILDWLSSSNFSAPQNSASDSRTPGTGQWLLNTKEYIHWRDFSAGLLWLHGVAGCGKSILSSKAIEDLQQLYKRNPQKRLAYWYFQFSDVNTQNVCNMLQSLLRQLSLSPLSSAIRGLRDLHQKSGSRPSTKELMEAIRNTINGAEQGVFIVIDALDECPLSERRDLLRRINELRNVSNKKVHILATSRWEPDINDELKNLPTIAMNIEDRFGNDIRLFVEAALHKDVKLSRWDEDSKSQIKEKLTAINETRFRWADLQIKRLQLCWDKPALTNALNTIPESLEQTYEEALKRIPAKYEERVRNILMWLTSSRRPMTLQEIAVIASFDIAQGVLELCSSLLVTLIDENVNQTIKLAHFSVKEYLILTTQKQELLSPYRFKNELAQAVISEMTVTYLLDTDKSIRLEKKVMPRSLLKYSAEFWPQHTVEAFNSNDPRITSGLQAQIDLLFSADYFSRYIAWLNIYDPDRGYQFNGKRKTAYPQPLYYASLLGLQKTVKNLLKKGCRITIEEGAYGNAYNAAAIHGDFEIVECLGKYHENIGSIANIRRIAREIRKNAEKIFTLFLKADSGALISYNVVTAAARNNWSGKEVMIALLEKRGDEVVITEEVVKAAAGNYRSGKEVIMLLLEKRKDEVVITEEVVKAAAGNSRSGKKVMMLLLEKRGDEVVITEEVVKAAAGNYRSGKEVIMLLLEKRKDEVVITEEVVKAAAGNYRSGKEMMMLLLEKRGADVVITEEVVKAAAGNYESGKEVMTLLLEKRGDEVVITEKVVKAAARNYRSGKEVMMLLLEKRGEEVVITEEVVKTVAGQFGKEVMMLLLEKRGDEVVITEEVVKAAAGNYESGEQVMMLLLEKRGKKVVITEEVVKTVAGRFGKEVMMLLLEKRGEDMVITEEVVKAVAGRFGKEVMMLLLVKRGEDMVITEEVVKAAAGNNESGEQVMMLLLEKRGDEVVITEEVVKTVAGRFGKEVMMLLLEKRGGKVVITEEVVKAAAENSRNGKEVMMLLLKKRGDKVVITEEVVKAAAGNYGSGEEVMMLLLEKRKDEVVITEEVVKAAAGNNWSGKKVMVLLLEKRGEKVVITEEVVKTVAGRFGKEVMMLLLEKRGDEVVITEEVVKAAAGNSRSGKKVMMLLLEKRGDEVVITEEVVKAAAGNDRSGKEVVMLLLEKRGNEVVITEEVVKTVADQFGEEVMMLLLEKRGEDMVITEEVVKTVAGRFGKEVMMLLLEKRGEKVMITEKVVKAAAGNYRSGKEVMALLLEKRGEKVVITKEVVKTVAGRFGKEVMMLLLEKRGGKVVITEEVVKAAAGNSRSGKKVMMLLLEKRGDEVVITEEVVKAAAENSRSGKEVMMLLLEKRGDKVVITEEVVKAAAGNDRSGKEVMILLLENRGDEVVITEKVVKTVAGRFGKEVMMLLLEKRGDKVVITEEVVKAAAGNDRSGKEVMMLLLEKRGADVVITEEVVKAAAGNSRSGKQVMMLLLEKRGADVVITEEVVKAAAGNQESGKKVMMLLLEKRGTDVVITEEVVKAIAGQFGEEVMVLLQHLSPISPPRNGSQ